MVGGAARRCFHVGAAQAFDSHHPGLGFQQDFADLPAQVLVPCLGTSAGAFFLLCHGAATSLAVARLAGDMPPVLLAAPALLLGSGMVGARLPDFSFSGIM